MDLGDGLLRHPLALYEVVFLVLLFIFLKRLQAQQWHWKPGGYFIVFMLSYFGFRFFLEFLKPNTFFILGLSSIQLLCVLCWVYYRKSLRELLVNGRK
jgi:prolipoprotein diacylglyceryltransferase